MTQELREAVLKLEEAKARLAAERKAMKDAALKRAQGLKLVKQLMRKNKLTVSDLTDPQYTIN